jgi:hypothetical protein
MFIFFSLSVSYFFFCFRATLCRMRGGSILTGVGDKVGIASYNVLNMFNQHKYQM